MHCLTNDQYEQMLADSDRLQFLIHHKGTLTHENGSWRAEKPDADGGASGTCDRDARKAIDSLRRERKNG